MRIGFIGLGHMGAAIAANAVKAGHDVVVFNRSSGKDGPLVALGAHSARSVAEASRGELVVTMLADDDAVREVVWNEEGLLRVLARGAIHVSMSTISVALSERLAGAHAEAGQRYVAAPVFGRPDAAAAGKLFVLAAGEAAALAECQPLFDAVGQRTFVLGADPPAANLVKLSGNFMLAAAIETLGEAIALVGKAGIDRQMFVDVLASSIFPAPAYRNYGGMIAGARYEPAGFAAVLGLKDVRLALEAAEALRVPLPIASLLRDRYLRLLAHGGAGLDWSAIGGLATADAGQE